MKKSKLAVAGTVLVMLMAGHAAFGEATAEPKQADAASKPLIQIAILLDTSGSMDGLIEQAKNQLWRVVNDFAKASGFYRAESWDLVDAVKADRAKVGDLKDEELPDELKNIPAGKRESYVAEKAKERAQIQEQIKRLSQERDTYIAAERAKAAQSGANTLDAGLIKAVRSQAQKLSFEF